MNRETLEQAFDKLMKDYKPGDFEKVSSWIKNALKTAPPEDVEALRQEFGEALYYTHQALAERT